MPPESKPVTADSMVALLQRMLAPQHAERLRGARIAAVNGAPPCTCGDCEICLWQYLVSPDDTLMQSAEKAIGENLNYRETLRQLHALATESVKRHEISLTQTKDGVTTPLTKPELDHLIRGLDGYIAYAKERVKEANRVEADSKAAVRGYHETARRAIEERDGLEKTARGLSAQYEACFALAVEALHISDPGALPKDTKLTSLIGRLASQRDTALSREIALRLFIEGHADYVTDPDVDALRVDVKTRGGTTVTYEGQELRNLVLTVVSKISEAWGLPGSPSARLIRDSRLAKQVADEARATVEWIPSLQVVPSEELQGKTPLGALRHVIVRLLARSGAVTEEVPSLGAPGAPPPDVRATVRANLAHLQSQAKASVANADERALRGE